MDNLENANTIRYLPNRFGGNEEIPDGLIGATITNIGTFDDQNLVEGGGLVIDFTPTGSMKKHRIVLAFDETAMWVTHRK